MDRSRTIWVLKRDGTSERFDVAKLTAAIWRAMSRTGASYEHAAKLAEAVGTYVIGSHSSCVSSAAVFEMVLKALKYVNIAEAAEAAENYCRRRSLLRRQLRIRHEGGRLTMWAKGWVCQFAFRSWRISRRTARILAGQVEQEILRSGQGIVSRSKVISTLNCLIAAYGLADAVPARLR